MPTLKLVQSRDEINPNPTKVGHALLEILSKEQPTYTAEEILSELGPDYLDLIRNMADQAKNIYPNTFYILSLMNKEMGQFGIANVLKHSCRPFHKEFSKKEVMHAHPNAVKNLFRVDVKNGEITLLWSIPGREDCVSIMKNPGLYDAKLVDDIKDLLNFNS